MEERKGLIQWIKGHKKQLIIAGVSIGSLILIIFGVKNQEEIKTLWDSLKRLVDHPEKEKAGIAVKVSADTPSELLPAIDITVTFDLEPIPFEVRRHIRNLPEGHHASPEKIAEAKKNNIILMENQTWVNSYMKGGAAA